MNLSQEEAFARIRLLRSPNVGPVSYAQLLRRFGNAYAAVEALPDLASRGGRAYRPAQRAKESASQAAQRANPLDLPDGVRHDPRGAPRADMDVVHQPGQEPRSRPAAPVHAPMQRWRHEFRVRANESVQPAGDAPRVRREILEHEDEDLIIAEERARDPQLGCVAPLLTNPGVALHLGGQRGQVAAVARK